MRNPIDKEDVMGLFRVWLCRGLLFGLGLFQGVVLGAQDLTAKLDALASNARITKKAAGLSVAVQIGDELVFAKGYGEADLEHHVAATPETVYRIASVTKIFTAAAILKLMHSERVDLHAAVGQHVPIFDKAREEITLHQLLTHTSGLMNYSRVIGDRNRLPLSREEVVSLFEDEDLDFAPGKRFKYSNSGYFLLGLAIEQLSGLSYGEFIERELVKPLNETLFCDNTRLIEDRARGYVFRSDRFQNAKPIEMNAPFSAGGLCSTVLDLVQWAQALFDGKVIPAGRVQQMTTPVKIRGSSQEYGYGLWIDELHGHPRFHHAGSIAGFSAFLAHYPDSDLSIAVLANTGGFDATGLGDQLAKAVFDVGVPGNE